MSMDPPEPGDEPEPADEPTRHPRERGVSRSVRQAVTVVAVLALATGLTIAVTASMEVISTWLQPRWVPLANTAFGLVLTGASLAALAWIAREW